MFGYSDTVRSYPLTVKLFQCFSTVTVSGDASISDRVVGVAQCADAASTSAASALDIVECILTAYLGENHHHDGLCLHGAIPLLSPLISTGPKNSDETS